MEIISCEIKISTYINIAYYNLYSFIMVDGTVKHNAWWKLFNGTKYETEIMFRTIDDFDGTVLHNVSCGK